MPLGSSLPSLLPEPSGSTFYVDPVSGNNSNIGSSGAPWLTLQKGLDNLGPGVTVRLRNGTYGTAASRHEWQATESGLVTNPGVLEADTGHAPVVAGRLRTRASYIKVRKGPGASFTVTGPSNDEVPLWWNGGTRPEYIGLTVINSDWNAGLYVNSGTSEGLFLNCRFTDNGDILVDTDRNGHHAIYWGNSSGYLVNCIFETSVAFGVQFYSGFGPGGTGVDKTMIVTGCTAYNNQEGYHLNHPGTSAFYNCIAYDNDTSGFRQYNQDGTSITVKNCLSNSHPSGNFDWEQSPAPTTDALLTSDPLFVDAPNGDYRLEALSPCIGAGLEEWAWPTDFEGTARSEPPDLGAFTFAAAGGDASATAVKAAITTAARAPVPRLAPVAVKATTAVAARAPTVAMSRSHPYADVAIS